MPLISSLFLPRLPKYLSSEGEGGSKEGGRGERRIDDVRASIAACKHESYCVNTKFRLLNTANFVHPRTERGESYYSIQQRLKIPNLSRDGRGGIEEVGQIAETPLIVRRTCVCVHLGTSVYMYVGRNCTEECSDVRCFHVQSAPLYSTWPSTLCY